MKIYAAHGIRDFVIYFNYKNQTIKDCFAMSVKGLKLSVHLANCFKKYKYNQRLALNTNARLNSKFGRRIFLGFQMHVS